MSEVVALLRGINLGRAKRISMAELRDLLSDAGYGDVRTHLQSGNVIVATRRTPDDAARDIERRLRDRFGFEVPVTTRTPADLRKVVRANPFADVATDGSRYFVTFLSEPLPSRALAKLDPDALAPERFVARRREIYAWCPDGVQRSRLSGILAEATAVTPATVRNWNTVTKLADMLQS